MSHTSLRVVLHEIQSMDNLGAVARLLANFGFTDLWLSAPQRRDVDEARKLGVHAGYILDALQWRETLPEALADAVYVLGTTSRTDAQDRVKLTPEAAAVRLRERAGQGRVVLLFGGERSGLGDAELAQCDDLVCIPTEPAQPSMNLSQAAGVMLYLCHREMTPGLAGASGPLRAQSPAEATVAPVAAVAPRAMLQALEERVRLALTHSGFLNPQQEELILRELVLSIFRAQLTQREAELWLNAFKHLARAVGAPQRPRGT